MPVLREYQERAVVACERSLRDGHSPLLTAPTGSGKTILGVHLAQRISRRCLWVAHRRELILQAAGAIEDAYGEVGIVMAGVDPQPDAPFQVASVQTLARRDLPDADLLVIDEAHHARADQYQRLIQRYRRRIGLTATPMRLDGLGLRGAGFDEIIVAAYTDDLCADGILHAPTVYAPANPDLRGVRKVGGDYAHGALEQKVLDRALIGNVVETWLKRAIGRRTVVFAVGLRHADALAERFRAAGVVTEVVTGQTPRHQRDAILARLRHGATTVVVNCQVLTEGWDLPALEVASIARPTASLNLHLQMIGRIMRACEGKDGAIILDHAGNYSRHGLVTDRYQYSLDDKPKKEEKGEAPQKMCPGCARVVHASIMQCPTCGYEFPGREPPVEVAGELVPVGHRDSFQERARQWAGFYRMALRVAARGTGELFAPTPRVLAIASAKYKSRYGHYPLATDGRLIHAANATEDEWVRMRARWREIAESRKWDAEKVRWFVEACEKEARGRPGEAVA